MKTMFSIADSRWRGCAAGGLVASLACVAVGASEAGAAVSGACTPRANPTPYNVVLFLLDDTSSAEIPFLGVPVDWNNGSLAKSTATTVGNTTVPAVGTETLREARTRRPDLNRLSARMYAEPGSPTCESGESPPCDLDKNFLHPNTAAKGKKVIPLGFGDVGSGTGNDAAQTDFYKERYGSACQTGSTNCDPRRDVLTTHGGFRQLAREGVVYPRFYATSGRCTPTRVSVLTGRHPKEVGVTDNGNSPKKKAPMIGDYLKAMCDGEGVCYDTGFVGKWHVGGSEAFQQTPWQRGFDEAIYFSAGSRKPWSMGDFRCNSPKSSAELDSPDPGAGYFCDYSNITSPNLDVENLTCTSDSDCSNVCAPSGGGPIPGEGGDAVCVCGPDQKCRILNPDPCTEDSQCTFVRGGTQRNGTCRQWGLYVGAQQASGGMQRRACSPKRAEWDPDCCAAPTEKVYSSDGPFDEVYDPAKKKAESTDVTPFFWKTEEVEDDVCRDDRHYRKANGGNAAYACMYDTRFYRDMAVNFISRHRYTPNDSRRFFLEVSLHAMHGVQAAPASTLAHYDPIGGQSSLDLERTQRPHASTKYWGMMEEVDAAVGAVLRELTGEDQGGGGGTSILDNTVVLLTSDQGRPSAGFGAPAFRDGKGSTHEGGLRVGLLARVPGGENPPGRGVMVNSGHVGSQADLFATIADAAGCQGGTKDEYELGSCQNAAGKVCNSNTDCGADGPCEIVTMGKSLMPELTNATTTTVARNASYGRYIGAPKAVITRKGYIQDGMLTEITTSTDKIGVCGVKVEVAGKGDSGSDHTADVIRRAGSCRTCKVGDATACDTEACIANGNYCVPTNFNGVDLTDKCKVNGQTDPSSCPREKLGTFRRCSTAEPCTGGYKCMNIEIPCDDCFEAEWKFLGGAGDGNGEDSKIRPQALYDLATNPEELDIPDRKSPDYRLNCLYPPTDDASNKDRLQAIGKHLCRRLDLWTDCVNAQNGAKCDFLMPSEGVASGFLGPDLELTADGKCQPPLSTSP